MNMFYNGEENASNNWITMNMHNGDYNEYVFTMEKKNTKMTQTIDRITMNMFYNGEEKYLKPSTELQLICFTMEKKNTSNSPLNYN